MIPVVAGNIFRLQEFLLGRKTFSILRKLNASQWWPRERIESLRLRRLRELIACAYENTAYWRAVMDRRGIRPDDIRTLDDLQRFDLLDKETLRANRDAMAWLGEGRGVRLTRTSGTTGSGVLEFYTSSYREANITAARIRGHQWIGINPGDTEVYFWAAPVELAAQDRLRQIRDWLTNTPLTNALEISPALVSEYVASWKRWKAKCLFGYPSTFCLFASMAGQAGIDLSVLEQSGLKAICTTAEMLGDEKRNVIAGAFGVPVYDSYGLREAGLIGHECGKFSMHTNDEQLILETIDRNTLEPTDGEGELVVTNLHSRVMPVIRYRTGDLVTLSRQQCACGRSLHSLIMSGGRIHEFIVSSDGRWIGSALFGRISTQVKGILKCQCRQDQLGEVRVLVVTDESFPADGTEQVAAIVQARLTSRDRVIVEQVDDIAPALSGKYRPVVSKVAENLRRQGRFTAES